jgi:acetyl-CoA C-acetyltransferase
MTQKSYIIDGFRIPTGKKGGYYKNVIPEAFTAHLLKYFKQNYPFLDSKLDELILGISLGTGGNMARFALLEAGFSIETPATSLDFQCGSSLKAILLAEAQIRSGMSDCLLVGGMESNSLAPKRQYHEKDPRFINLETFYSQATFAPPIFGDSSLTKAAENLAKIYQISKSEMLEWCVRSHQKALESIEKKGLNQAIIPFKGFEIDQTIRKNLSFSQLQQTASEQLIDHTNTAHLHDGASIVLMVGEKFCLQHQLQAKFEIVCHTVVGLEPHLAPKGVIIAVEKLLQKFNFSLKNIDLFEINESFAAKPLAFIKHFNIDSEKVNIFGGNLAFGHPFGASGAMNLIHLMKALEYSQKTTGLLAMAVAGGQGMAIIIRKIK